MTEAEIKTMVQADPEASGWPLPYLEAQIKQVMSLGGSDEQLRRWSVEFIEREQAKKPDCDDRARDRAAR